MILASQVVLFFTQEVGARLGLATGKGLIGLIRERFGVRWAAFAALLMLIANLGSTVAEFAGIGAALGALRRPAADQRRRRGGRRGGLHRPRQLQPGPVPLRRHRRRCLRRLRHLRVPGRPGLGDGGPTLWSSRTLPSSPAYWLAVVGTVGTTITPWGQAFIQSYVADKGLGPEDLPASRLDVVLGALLTNMIAAFIVIACAATLWAHGSHASPTRPTPAQALEPLAGRVGRRSSSPSDCSAPRSWASAWSR